MIFENLGTNYNESLCLPIRQEVETAQCQTIGSGYARKKDRKPEANNVERKDISESSDDG